MALATQTGRGAAGREVGFVSTVELVRVVRLRPPQRAAARALGVGRSAKGVGRSALREGTAALTVAAALATSAVADVAGHPRGRRRPVTACPTRTPGIAARRAGLLEEDAPRKIAIVTGASGGVGKATVEGLARSGQFSHVVLAGRNAGKHEGALSALREMCGEAGASVQLRHIEVDLASLASVKAFVKAFDSLALPSLDALVLNAGIMMLPERFVTEDGFERQMGVNHCGHFALLNLLLPRLVASGSLGDPSRVISLSSAAHLADSPLGNGQLQDLMWTGEGPRYSPGAAYAQSKLANVIMVYELHRRAQEDGLPIVASAVHPGGVQSDLGRYLIDGMADPETGDLMEKALNMPAWQEALIRGVVNTFVTPKTPAEGARTPVMLATCTPSDVKSGLYWADEKPTPSLGKVFNPLSGGTSYDEKVWREFWALSEEWTGVRYNPWAD